MKTIDEFVEGALCKLARRCVGDHPLKVALEDYSIVRLEDANHVVRFPIGRVCDAMTRTCIEGGGIEALWARLLRI